MKRLLITFILISVIIKTYSQDYSVGINIPSLSLLNLSVMGETYLTDNSAVNLGIGLRPDLPGNSDSYYNNLRGISVTPAYRYYFKGYTNSGWFTGGYLRYQSYRTGEFYKAYEYWSGLTIKQFKGYYQTGIGIGVTLGYRIVRDNHSFDIFVAPRITSQNFEVRYYRYPLEATYQIIDDFENIFDFSLPGVDEATFVTNLDYDKGFASVIYPAVRVGFVFNYFLQPKQQDVHYEEY